MSDDVTDKDFMENTIAKTRERVKRFEHAL